MWAGASLWRNQSDCDGENAPFRITCNNVQIGIVRYWSQRQSGREGSGQYRFVPEVIEQPNNRNSRIQAGHVNHWWLAVQNR